MTRIRAMQWGALAAGITFACTVFVILFMQGSGTPPTSAPRTSTPTQPAGPATLSAAPDNLRITNAVRVSQLVQNAVVNITSSRIMTTTVRASTGNPVFDSMIPPNQLPTQQVQVQAQSLGSGFVIHPAGYIITNEHVIEGGFDVQCVFANGLKLAANVIATDSKHDLAVLKVSPAVDQPLTALALGGSEDLMVGEPVYAFGNPLGYASSMSSGIVSALNRTLPVSPTKSYEGLIQTDAAINPGNSGGPLINAYGQVIGINTAIRSDAQGICFAISVSNMRDLLPDVLNPEVLNRALVGFSLRERRDFKPPAGVLAQISVSSVQMGSDAYMKGLREGDIVNSIAGVSPANVVDALVALASAKPGQDLDLQVQRGSGADLRKMSLQVAVTNAPLPPVEQILLSKMGIRGQTITPPVTAKYNLAVNVGVYIDAVEPNSPAQRCGIQPGDVLLQLGAYYVRSPDDVALLLKTVTHPVDVPLRVVRGKTLEAPFTISLQ